MKKELIIGAILVPLVIFLCCSREVRQVFEVVGVFLNFVGVFVVEIIKFLIAVVETLLQVMGL